MKHLLSDRTPRRKNHTKPSPDAIHCLGRFLPARVVSLDYGYAIRREGATPAMYRESRSSGHGRSGTNPALMLTLLVALFLPGCVERTVSIHTEPEGATVFLNDQEVGKSPVKVPFTWYGDYDIVIRKEGYQTLKTNRRIDAPWYQWPFIDFFAECLVPFTIHDHHVMDVLVLEPRQSVDKEVLLQSAAELRARALGEAP